ncbi:MAG: hypothetical protein ACD_11C00116G0005 [uncultured bacterium]|nr:MAG: hypothetical protein ACD_11C00116G0005 [uncultured bacterium]HBR71251.1 hypothetical protein [Candidatus Moranbacteria bacterium]
MPELPEVQTIVDDLNRKIKGDVIVGFWSDWLKSIKIARNGKVSLAASQNEVEKEIANRKILQAWRIGKNMFIDLSGGKTIYIHLKMTGHLLIKKETESRKKKATKKDYFKDKVNQYIHHIWYLKSGITLEFSDLRKFAKIVLVDTDKIKDLAEIKKLGVDAMSPEFTLKKFKEILGKKSRAPIGIVLMEQELIAGIGNIYRSEILFRAGINPQRKISSLTAEEIKEIYKNIKKILKLAIKLRGTSDSDYRDSDGAPGNFQKVLRVYNKENEPCKKCGTIIKRFKMGQRSVFHCPQCQK